MESDNKIERVAERISALSQSTVLPVQIRDRLGKMDEERSNGVPPRTSSTCGATGARMIDEKRMRDINRLGQIEGVRMLGHKGEAERC